LLGLGLAQVKAGSVQIVAHWLNAVAAAPPYPHIVAPWPRGCRLLWFKRGASTLLPGLMAP
jgi:hypothetical protein